MKTSKRIELPKVVLIYAILSTLALAWIYFAHLDVTFLGIKGIPEAAFLAFLLFILSALLTIHISWAQKLEEFFAQIVTPLTFPVIFILALCSSVGEELFFRGALQNQFGLVTASIVFGLVHIPWNKLMIPWTLMAMTMGFVLGGLYIYSENLLAPIFLHFTINLLNLWAINQKYSVHST